MQDFLTVAIEAIAIASTVYLFAGFVKIATVPKPVALSVPVAAELPTQQELDAVMEALAIAAAPLAFVAEEPTVSQPQETSVPNWAAIAPEQLRKECQARGIKWRNADPLTGKHLRKAAMVKALASC